MENPRAEKVAVVDEVRERFEGADAVLFTEYRGLTVAELSQLRQSMRAAGGDNHHDLGLFSVGPDAPHAQRRSTGLYHLAWEVPSIEDLASASEILAATGALGGASDHGVSKSLYGADPDGNEFEIMWRVPRDAWGEHEERGTILPLDMDAEVRRWGAKV